MSKSRAPTISPPITPNRVPQSSELTASVGAHHPEFRLIEDFFGVVLAVAGAEVVDVEVAFFRQVFDRRGAHLEGDGAVRGFTGGDRGRAVEEGVRFVALLDRGVLAPGARYRELGFADRLRRVGVVGDLEVEGHELLSVPGKLRPFGTRPRGPLAHPFEPGVERFQLEEMALVD